MSFHLGSVFRRPEVKPPATTKPGEAASASGLQVPMPLNRTQYLTRDSRSSCPCVRNEEGKLCLREYGRYVQRHIFIGHNATRNLIVGVCSHKADEELARVCGKNPPTQNVGHDTSFVFQCAMTCLPHVRASTTCWHSWWRPCCCFLPRDG